MSDHRERIEGRTGEPNTGAALIGLLTSAFIGLIGLSFVVGLLLAFV